ncbi:MAG: cobalamin biosynthesis protein [Candidatus Competibacterales bacterium]
MARATGGVCVVTGARPYTHPVHVAGLGCARGCGVETLGDLLDRALAEVGLGQRDLAAVASIDLKGDEGGLLALAEHLNVPVGWYSAQALNRYHSRLTDPSEVVFQAVGCYGVAEGAALAHAEALTGDTAELLLPKRKNAHATVALARAYRDGDEPESTLPPREAR